MLIFGQAYQGGGALDPSDDAEICGCNGVCKGVIARVRYHGEGAHLA